MEHWICLDAWCGYAECAGLRQAAANARENAGKAPRLQGSRAPRFPGSKAPRLQGSRAPRFPGSKAPRLLGSKALTGACKHPKHKHSEIHYMDYKTTPGPKSSKKPPWPHGSSTISPCVCFTTCFQCVCSQLASNAVLRLSHLLPMRMFTTTDVFHDMSGWQLVSQFCAYGQLTLCAINRTLTSNQPTTNRHRNHLATIAQPRGP